MQTALKPSSDSFIQRFKISAGKILRQFLAIRGEPHEIAMSLALGLFIGMMPVMGIHIVIAVFITTLLRWNKLAAVLAVWITNPISAPFIYGINYMIGARLLGLHHTPALELKLDNLLSFLEKAPHFFWALTVGGVITGLPLALVGYAVAYKLTVRYQDKIRRQIARQKERLLRKRKKNKKKKNSKKGFLLRRKTDKNVSEKADSTSQPKGPTT